MPPTAGGSAVAEAWPAAAASCGPSSSWPGCSGGSTGPGRRPARGPRPRRAPTPPPSTPGRSGAPRRGPASSRCHAATRSRARSAGPRPPTSRTPASRPSPTSTLPGMRSPWVIRSSPDGGRSRSSDQRRRNRGTSTRAPLRSRQACTQSSWSGRCPPRPLRPQPRKVLPRVSMPRTPTMNSARSWANVTDPLGSSTVATVPGSQVCTDHGSGYPAPGSPSATGSGVGNGSGRGVAPRLRLGLQLSPDVVRLAGHEREPGDERGAQAEQRVHRALGGERPYGQVAPARELPVHERADDVLADPQLSGMHLHHGRIQHRRLWPAPGVDVRAPTVPGGGDTIGGCGERRREPMVPGVPRRVRRVRAGRARRAIRCSSTTTCPSW